MISSLAFAQLDQKTSRELMTQRRGQVPVRGSNPLTLTGTVFDASCKDRSSLNLAVPPESLAETVPAQPAATAAGAKTNAPAGGVSVDGITVSAKTLAAERSDPLEHQVPDLRTRQQDPTCAITGATSLYAIALSDGRILNLDEGGNTLAGESVLQSSQGRAMLNGTAYGFKPRAKVTGRIRGDRLFVEQLSFF
ncbi:MAG TPA: hypothetical protein VG456_18330 [Candidatus Sulfopaludibacter sp.]|nr:hypothetical protein [Candidatus Sulfopaludibacter sp.]